MPQIAYLGTGLLGAAFVHAALGRGDHVTVWNRTAAKAEALAPLGATVAATPADAVRGATRVHLVLTDDDVVDEVIARLRPGLAADAIVLDHSTTLPSRTAERLPRLNTAGVRYLHCPVFIGPPAARESRGIIMVSGPQALFEVVRPALEQQAERVVYWGEQPDLAATYKLCGNAFILGMAGLVADVFQIARGGGVAPTDALRLLEFFNPAGIIAGRGRKMAAGDYTATFELTMARKDLRLMLETAAPRPLTLLPGLAARMDAHIAAGDGASDLGVIGRE